MNETITARITPEGLKAVNENPPLQGPIVEEKDYPTLDQLWALALKREIPGAKADLDNPEVVESIREHLRQIREQMLQLDLAAQKPFQAPAGLTLASLNIARLSNPGTYFSHFKEIDKGKFGEWGRGLERQADDAVVATMVQLLAEPELFAASGLEGRNILTGTESSVRGEIRQKISAANPHVFYAGLPEEAAAVTKVLSTDSSYIDPELVKIISQENGNTITQLLALKDFLDTNPSDKVVLVGFAAHLTRALWLAESLDVFTKDSTVYLSLLPTPAAGLESADRPAVSPSMVAQEIKATLYYVLTGKAKEPSFRVETLGNPWLSIEK